MPKRKPPEQFDVADFLRGSDDDLKSALHSLLRTPESERPVTNLDSPNKLEPPPNSGPPPNSVSPTNLSATRHATARRQQSSSPAPSPQPPVTNLGSGLNLVTTQRRFAIREMRQPQDAHTRAEQHVYERLWQNAHPYDPESRTITIGFGALAKLAGLSESNARINLRNLIAKLAVEEIAEYNCERSVGRTYRVFSEAEILRRRREAGLVWFMRRTLAVVFVDPATGQPLLQRKSALQHRGLSI